MPLVIVQCVLKSFSIAIRVISVLEEDPEGDDWTSNFEQTLANMHSAQLLPSMILQDIDGDNLKEELDGEEFELLCIVTTAANGLQSYAEHRPAFMQLLQILQSYDTQQKHKVVFVIFGSAKDEVKVAEWGTEVHYRQRGASKDIAMDVYDRMRSSRHNWSSRSSMESSSPNISTQEELDLAPGPQEPLPSQQHHMPKRFSPKKEETVAGHSNSKSCPSRRKAGRKLLEYTSHKKLQHHVDGGVMTQFTRSLQDLRK